MERSAERRAERWRRALRLGALALLLAAVGFAFMLDPKSAMSWLGDNYQALDAWASERPLPAAAAYVAAYALTIAVAVPGASILTILGGALFGIGYGGLLALVGATIGATAVFLLARFAIGDSLHRHAGPALRRLEQGFRADAVNYLLVLRLIPVFPFWLVNVAPAAVGMKLRSYVLATFFGILPGTFIYASFGDGLVAVLESGRTPGLGIVLDRRILLPLLGLALLALLPVAYRRWRRDREAASGG